MHECIVKEEHVYKVIDLEIMNLLQGFEVGMMRLVIEKL